MPISCALARTPLIDTFEYRYWRRRLRGGRFPVVYFHPHLPWARATAYRICHVLGAKMTNRPDAHADLIELATLATRRPVLNLRCVDISKRHVERLHRQVLKPDEVERLLEFCGAIGLDYGELDVLRDNGDGRIYVVDVNNTPDGPPNHLPDADAEIALQQMADAFTQAFLPAFRSRAW